MANRLINSTSSYLLQHAHQLVDWHPWCDEALAKAVQEDKPILLSIGYAACHWCHVMARETFENSEVATLMNTSFVCIKVDREERPDIDHVYVNALHAMGLQAGWPLHVFLLPNQQPFYGGNYFSINAWKQVVKDIKNAYQTHKNQLTSSATHFVKSMRKSVSHKQKDDTYLVTPRQLFETIYEALDHQHGGLQGAFKFPMPTLSTFLACYYQATQDPSALQQLHLTLGSMANGGIYDQLGGGFYRYTTDKGWKVPHFEKMLCDNGQLISLYALAYKATAKARYRTVAEETIQFVVDELRNNEGGFYSSLDAESEGKEGKFYTWTYTAIAQALGKDTQGFIAQFGITQVGNWQYGRNMLYQNRPPTTTLDHAKKKLLAIRNKKQRPNRDNKLITSWNAIMLHGLIDAYSTFHNEQYLVLALDNAAFIEQHLYKNKRLYHSLSQGQLGQRGYLEDYGWVIRAFVSLHQATLQEKWLTKAEQLTQYVLTHFYDDNTGLFRFVDKREPQLISQHHELYDQAMPSANAIMVYNLLALGILLDKRHYTSLSQQMINQVSAQFMEKGAYLSQWASLYIQIQQPAIVATITGPKYQAIAKQLKGLTRTVWLIRGIPVNKSLGGVKEKRCSSETVIHICCQGTCYPPTTSVEESLKQIEKTYRPLAQYRS